MIKAFIQLGNIGRSLSWWGYFIVATLPPVLINISGYYEKVGLTYSILFTILALICGLVLAILISIAIERFFPPKKPIPLLDVFKLANNKGWNLLKGNSLDIIDLIDALREAGSRGDLIFCGRENISEYGDLTRNHPKTDIPPDYWKNFNIAWGGAFQIMNGEIRGFSDNNFNLQSQKFGKIEGSIFKDLHVISPNINKWLKNAKNDYQGRRAIQSEANKKQQEEMEKYFNPT